MGGGGGHRGRPAPLAVWHLAGATLLTAILALVAAPARAAETAEQLVTQGWALLARGEAEAAAHHFGQALGGTAGHLPPLAVANAHAGVAYSRQALGDLEAAERHWRLASTAYAIAGHPDHPDRGAANKLLGDLLRSQGRLAEARPAYEEAVALWTAAYGPDEEPVVAASSALADVLLSLGAEPEALAIWQELLASRRRLLGAAHPATVAIANVLAGAHVAVGRFAIAEALYRETLDTLGSGDGQNGRERASVLDGLAGVYVALGRQGRAAALLQEALCVAERTVPADVVMVETLRNNLATALRDGGDYARAEPLYREALARLAAAGLDAEETLYGTVLNELGRLYAEIGDGERARELYTQSRAVYVRTVGPEHFFVASNLTGLGTLALESGDAAGAEEHFAAALAIYRRTLGPADLHTLVAQGNLAAAHQRQDEVAAAESLLVATIGGLESLLGADHPDTATYRNNLGVLLLAQGRHEDAERVFEEALEAIERSAGPAHPVAASIRKNLALLSGVRGRLAPAVDGFRRTLADEDEVLANVFAIASERQRLAFVDKTSEAYQYLLSLVHRRLADDPEAVRGALDAVLARKAIVFDAQSRQRASLAAALAPEQRAAWERVAELRAALAKALLAPPPGAVAATVERIAQLRRQIDELESALASTSRLVAGELRKRRAASREIAARLPERSVLVEVVRFRDVDWRTGRWSATYRYVAFVLAPDGAVSLVDLGAAAELESRVDALMEGFRGNPHSRRGHRLQEVAVDRLYDLLWQPLVAAVAGAERVWISPDGILNLVPFAALRAPSGRHLVEVHTLAYLTSGRDLVSAVDPRPDGDLFALANPAFGGAATGDEAPAESPPGGRRAPSRSSPSFPSLPGTEIEARGVFAYVSGERKVLVTGEAASEAAVLAAGRPRVMHLATHGFFLGGEATAEEARSGAAGPAPWLRDHPLARSGLALAGANAAGEVASSLDGILTALELSSLDLRGTELVTLSACDTGRGEVRNGEGVFGLRRAFALAGARYLLISLWPIADDLTARQILAFYRRYGSGEDPAAALRQAQLDTIASLRRDLGSAPPSLWAPFALQGAPAP